MLVVALLHETDYFAEFEESMPAGVAAKAVDSGVDGSTVVWYRVSEKGRSKADAGRDVMLNA